MNICRDRLRRRRRITFIPIEPEVTQADRRDPFRTVLDRDQVVRAMAHLNADERVALVLHYWADLTLDAVAERLGWPVGTGKSCLHHGLREIRRRLAELPAEPRGSRFAGVLGRLRWVALASAAAAAVAFVIVVRSLPGPTGVGPGASLQSPNSSAVTATPSPGATAQPTTGPTGSAPPATPTLPPVSPANSPSPGPSAGAGFTCAVTTVLPATTSAVVQVNDVRLGSHAGYDRIVFEFAGTGRHGLTVAVAGSRA